jgi:hypothetical protein
MTNQETKSGTLTLKRIFRCMMEDGYYPEFEKTHILFDMDGNTAVVEYQKDILSVQLFFSIESELSEMFLEASNHAMLDSFIVKPVVLDDRKNIMFSCEIICDNMREFRKFFPRAIERLRVALMSHKSEMKKLLLASETTAPKVRLPS